MTMTMPEARAQRRLGTNLTPLHWFEIVALVGVIVAITPAFVGRVSQRGVGDVSNLIPSLVISDSSATNLVAQPVWGAMIGDGEQALSSTARAIRLGASIGTFEVLHARGSPGARASAIGVATMLETFESGFEAASTYRSLAMRTPSDSEVRAAGRRAEDVGGAKSVQLGAWLQGARFAAAGSDTTWFAGNVASKVARLAITIDDRADTEHAAKQFEQILGKRPHDFTAIATSAEELLRLLGTR